VRNECMDNFSLGISVHTKIFYVLVFMNFYKPFTERDEQHLNY
jgi:hypothetical protein